MPRPSSAEQARRLLTLIGMLEPGTEAPLSELAGTLGVSASQVASDLEMLSMCGIAPYSPGDLVPLYVEGDRVTVYGSMPALDRRVRLSATEARALAAALQAAGRNSADALVKRLLLAASDAADPGEIERVIRTAAGADPGIHATLSCATRRSEAVRITYQAGGTETLAERVIEPRALLNERGVWYVDAFCRTAGAMRTFRIDRVADATPTGEHFEPGSVTVPGRALPTEGLPRAVVHLAPGVEVPEREWPGLRIVSEDASGTLIELPYAGTEWIARQVASFLGAARVLKPAEVREKIARLAASELGALTVR
ncbi:MAG: WYL domain-containing protein [Anaerosomatales bacterium]|nr:WYL domain-containing protein [Anaerosomatales bacterium]MDT8433746.1 WYL domain-containing protein [Anaerosomatales bacterium]